MSAWMRHTAARGNAMQSEHHYRIRIAGKLDAHWSAWFDGLSIVYVDAQAETVLAGAVADQAALHGLLAKIRDLNLELISVERSSST